MDGTLVVTILRRIFYIKNQLCACFCELSRGTSHSPRFAIGCKTQDLADEPIMFYTSQHNNPTLSQSWIMLFGKQVSNTLFIIPQHSVAAASEKLEITAISETILVDIGKVAANRSSAETVRMTSGLKLNMSCIDRSFSEVAN